MESVTGHTSKGCVLNCGTEPFPSFDLEGCTVVGAGLPLLVAGFLHYSLPQRRVEWPWRGLAVAWLRADSTLAPRHWALNVDSWTFYPFTRCPRDEQTLRGPLWRSPKTCTLLFLGDHRNPRQLGLPLPHPIPGSSALMWSFPSRNDMHLSFSPLQALNNNNDNNDNSDTK